MYLQNACLCFAYDGSPFLRGGFSDALHTLEFFQQGVFALFTDSFYLVQFRSGLSLALDLLGSVLSKGNTVADISSMERETGLTQVMIAFSPSLIGDEGDDIIAGIIEYMKSSSPAEEGGVIYYPGEHSYQVRQDNLANGIPVIDEVWESVLRL